MRLNNQNNQPKHHFFDFFQKGHSKADLSHLTKLIDNPFVVMTYNEAMDVLEQNAHKVILDEGGSKSGKRQRYYVETHVVGVESNLLLKLFAH